MENRNRYRLKFNKFGRIRFIGHLDLLRLFQRTIKKSKLPISYSNGFNPHQKMSFGSPLSLGYKSNGEYIDIELDEEVNLEEIKNKINNNLPEGIEILNVKKLLSTEKNSASVLMAGKYFVEVKNFDNLKQAIKKINDLKKLIVEKETKSGTKEEDIRKYIYNLDYINDNEFSCIISTGSIENLKIDLLVKTLYQFMNLEYNELDIKYTREEMYCKKNNKLEALI